jgi:chemotaxis protein CheD
MGELAVTRDSSVVLTCIGLGSCIAMCVFDPVKKTGGMAHMLLPTRCSKQQTGFPEVKYVDDGAPLLIQRLLKQGSTKEDLIVKITGGARMLNIPGNSHLDIGQRNIAEIKTALSKLRIPIAGEDLGGGFGRTVQFFLDTGRVTVKSVNGVSLEL